MERRGLINLINPLTRHTDYLFKYKTDVTCYLADKYLNIEYSSIKMEVLDEIEFDRSQYNTSFIIHMNLKSLQFEKMNDVMGIVGEKLVNEHWGDILYEVKDCGDIFPEEVFILYTVAD